MGHWGDGVMGYWDDGYWLQRRFPLARAIAGDFYKTSCLVVQEAFDLAHRRAAVPQGRGYFDFQKVFILAQQRLLAAAVTIDFPPLTYSLTNERPGST